MGVSGKKLISNTIYLYLNWISITILGFIYWAIIGKNLLPNELGILSTVINLVGFVSTITFLGFHAAIMKLIPEWLEQKESEKINWLVKFSGKTILLVNLIVVFIFFLLGRDIATILNIPVNAVYLASIILVVFTFQYFYHYILIGFQNMKKIAITSIIGHSAKVAFSALFIYYGFGYLGPLLGFFIGMLIMVLIRFNSVNIGSVTKVVNTREIFFEFALPAFIVSIAWTIISNGQYIVISALKGTDATGIFSIGMLLTLPISIIPQVMQKALFPVISQLSTNKNKKGSRGYLIGIVIRYALFFSLPMAAFLVPFSRHAILIISRPEYLAASIIFPVLAAGSIMQGIGGILANSLYAIGKTKVQRNIIIFTTLIFLATIFPLTYFFSYRGAAFACGIAAFSLLALSVYYTKKFIKVYFQFKDLIKMIFAAMISLSFLYLMTFVIEGLLLGFVFLFISALIYSIVLFHMGFYIKEDVSILNFLAEVPFLGWLKKVSRYLSRHVD